jgi:hypothetical protein
LQENVLFHLLLPLVRLEGEAISVFLGGSIKTIVIWICIGAFVVGVTGLVIMNKGTTMDI